MPDNVEVKPGQASTDQQQLVELQSRIAHALGWTFLRQTGPKRTLVGFPPGSSQECPAPRWPWAISGAWGLVREMEADPALYGYTFNHDPHPTPNTDSVRYEFLFYGAASNHDYEGRGETAEEAICRCWCAWKGIDV